MESNEIICLDSSSDSENESDTGSKLPNIRKSVVNASNSSAENKNDVKKVKYENVNINPYNGDAIYYAVQDNLLSAWKKCQIVTKHLSNSGNNGIGQYRFTIKFLNGANKGCLKNVPVHQLACGTMPEGKLKAGRRIIAEHRSRENNDDDTHNLRPGIIAEPLMEVNKRRYLVFFDDGDVNYVKPENIRIIYDSNTWQNVHSNARRFAQYYLEHYFSSGVPMASVSVGTPINVELNGKWLPSHVVDVDHSIIKVQFNSTGRTEWLFKGSPRLEPIWRSMLQTKRIPENLIENSVREIHLSDTSDEEEDASNTEDEYNRREPVYTVKEIRLKNQVENFLKPRTWSSHKCSTGCLYRKPQDLNLKNVAQLVKPLLCGWRRVSHIHGTKIHYVAPCGRRLYHLSDLYEYLQVTQCYFDVDCFSFERLNCLNECTVKPRFIVKEDISDGMETIPIPVINDYSTRLPKQFTYLDTRKPNPGVSLNLNRDFMSCCDCEDNCSDKEKCQCWQLTLAGLKYEKSKSSSVKSYGYTYKRLTKEVKTGIFECNINCKCTSACLNRVAQQPLQVKLQLFRTAQCGWGVRSVNDIPRGTFITTYTGDLLTEEHSNRLAKKQGDMYFAQLDYIEYGERVKFGYESGVVIYGTENEQITEYDDVKDDPGDDEDTNFMKPPHKRARLDSSSSNQSTYGSPVIQKNYFPTFNVDDEPETKTSTRQWFGANEEQYIIDGFKFGNVGRFFNHSCDANLFVQNVFIDTHDIRFPWMAIFARKNIKAGTELTWNYHYVVGSVPGRVIHCHCNSKYCKGRLL